MKTSTKDLAPSDVSPAKSNQEASVRRDNARQSARSTPPLAAQRAAAILDVLAGQRTTTEAASALEISVNHYYLLERRALEGLMAACEPQPQGPPGPTLETQLQKLEQQLAQCRRECLRQAALVRATQRAVGLPAAEAKTKPPRKKNSEPARKKRQPTVRALKAAERLRENSSGSKPAVELEPGDMNSGAASSSLPEKEHNDGHRG
ncbi:MAG: hypothetical protein HYV60_14215 [Planctomycetia bacterium]|nr:hypothetical protein [Planctomycetia bacterium]